MEGTECDGGRGLDLHAMLVTGDNVEVVVAQALTQEGCHAALDVVKARQSASKEDGLPIYVSFAKGECWMVGVPTLNRTLGVSAVVWAASSYRPTMVWTILWTTSSKIFIISSLSTG